MSRISVYSTRICPYCVMAKRLLSAKGAAYDDLRIDQDESARAEMQKRAPASRTVPQIFIGETHVGGFDELAALDRAGKLDAMLAPYINEQS
ncbi:glutaredoxin 3 [Algiphilus aromaticivorans]|jgi:glutaredoxin 3|uniref:glutaredoxin 3 n=1 Tax=Algiphilus aromaticivorans TaxID=382454 RepID=UPI0005C23437|nr:glutaredoxin 3 [Algiphilus aromaticivorans]